MVIILVDLLWKNIICCRKDVCHEGAVLNVLIITDDMDSIVTRLCGPVENITGAITLIITLDLCLRWSFNGKSYTHKHKLKFISCYYYTIEIEFKTSSPPDVSEE